MIAHVDNKTVLESLKSSKLVDVKRRRLDIATVSERLKTVEVTEVRWCTGKESLTSCLTKRGASGFELLNVFH